MSKRYYPITGLICRSTIPVPLYSNIEIKIIPREGCRKEITDAFKNATAFIEITEIRNNFMMCDILKEVIAIIFLSHSFSVNSNDDEDDNHFFRLITTKMNYFTTKIGSEIVDTDFSNRIPYFKFSGKEYQNPLIHISLFLTDDTNDIIGGAKKSSLYFFKKIITYLSIESELNKKIRNSLVFIFEFIYNKIDTTLFLYSCLILEILLLKDSEEGKKSKVSNRATSLIFKDLDIKLKKDLALKIQELYKRRSEIVHEGKKYIDFYNEIEYEITFEINFAKNLFIKLIEIIIKENIRSVDDVINLANLQYNRDNCMEGYL